MDMKNSETRSKTENNIQSQTFQNPIEKL